MAPLTQNVRDDPQSAPWNNENREFERGRQNMMGFSCMKQDCLRIHLFTSKAEKNIFLRDIHQIFMHITYKKAIVGARICICSHHSFRVISFL